MEDNIKMDLTEGVYGVEWITLAWDMDQWPDCCEHCDEHSGFVKYGFFANWA
jgi:hypothetical protein